MEHENRSDLPPRPPEEVAAPDPDARKAFESREEYKGFRLPKGMSLPQRRAVKKAIDEREAFPAKFQRQFPRVAKDVVSDTFQGMKETAKEGAKAVGEGLLEAATVVPRTKAAIAADPEGAKQLARSVMSGDREAIRSVATEASEGIAEPFATMGDVTLGGMAAQEGKFGEAAGFAGLVLAPGILQTLGKSMSKGWLKSAAEAGEEIPDEAARKMSDLAKRVDEGKVTNDMQIRRELAQIEDDHLVEYAKSRPIEDPMQQGMSRPRADVDPEGAREFDREPPGYMGMSRSNQPMSSFSEGQERFVNELRTDMTEDTNFGELAVRFSKDLDNIDKREDLLRSTGKDMSGRQLDDVEISREYEKLSNERQSLANEYYIAKAEREAALRAEGSYVPGRSIDDIEGPSEVEIQQMVEQSRFGDPERLEMLKEDMRRMAELRQQWDVARTNIRRTRTPGTPGEFSQTAEGTSRADRKGTPRERPESKKN